MAAAIRSAVVVLAVAAACAAAASSVKVSIDALSSSNMVPAQLSVAGLSTKRKGASERVLVQFARPNSLSAVFDDDCSPSFTLEVVSLMVKGRFPTCFDYVCGAEKNSALLAQYLTLTFTRTSSGLDMSVSERSVDPVRMGCDEATRTTRCDSTIGLCSVVTQRGHSLTVVPSRDLFFPCDGQRAARQMEGASQLTIAAEVKQAYHPQNTSILAFSAAFATFQNGSIPAALDALQYAKEKNRVELVMPSDVPAVEALFTALRVPAGKEPRCTSFACEGRKEYKLEALFGLSVAAAIELNGGSVQITLKELTDEGKDVCTINSSTVRCNAAAPTPCEAPLSTGDSIVFSFNKL